MSFIVFHSDVDNSVCAFKNILRRVEKIYQVNPSQLKILSKTVFFLSYSIMVVLKTCFQLYCIFQVPTYASFTSIKYHEQNIDMST